MPDPDLSENADRIAVLAAARHPGDLVDAWIGVGRHGHENPDRVVRWFHGHEVTVDGIPSTRATVGVGMHVSPRPMIALFDDGVSPYGRPYICEYSRGEPDVDYWVRTGVLVTKN